MSQHLIQYFFVLFERFLPNYAWFAFDRTKMSGKTNPQALFLFPVVLIEVDLTSFDVLFIQKQVTK